MERFPEGPVFAGIDVAKDRLDAHLRPSAEAFAATRDGVGLANLVERLMALRPTLVVLEATGGFEVAVAAAIAAAGLSLAVASPRQIRDFARATGRLGAVVEVAAASAELRSCRCAHTTSRSRTSEPSHGLSHPPRVSIQSTRPAVKPQTSSPPAANAGPTYPDGPVTRNRASGSASAATGTRTTAAVSPESTTPTGP